MKKIILLFLVFAINLLQAQVPQSERDALVALYNATDGLNWYNNSNWNTTSPVSSWYGVSVRNINGQDHVTKIELRYKNLTGNLPAEIGDFPYLIELNLQRNHLSGSIPTEIGNLINLSYLNLGRNDLSGTIPSGLSSLNFLESVYLDNNHFSGLFPDFTSNTNLKYLNITKNDFQFGDLEPYFNAINNLIQSNNGYFYYSPMNKLDMELVIDMVTGTNYTFTMPTVSGTNVTYQWYRNDTEIPGATSQTYTINNAQHSDLGDYVCKASSPVIPDLTIDRNTIHLYGTVLQSDKDTLLALYNATDGPNWTNHDNWNTNEKVYNWYGVKMRGNRISEIDLHNNNLNGTIPGSIGDLNGLIKLDLSKNGSFYPGDLHGSIPSEIGNLSSLKYLWIDFANLSGNIPSEIGNLSNLIDLDLWYNQLTGSIPPEIGNLLNLEIFTVEDNPLTGTIPASLANLTKMRSFWIGNNQLTGDIPAGLFDNMPDLYYAAIYGNDVTGDVDLSYNPGLRGVWMYDTQISTLDIRNSQNQIMWYFYADNNPNLTCIFVDDATWSTTNWSNVDSDTHFVETQAECDALSIDESFKTNIKVFPNPFTDKIEIIVADASNIKTISIQNMQGQMVYKSDYTNQVNLANLRAGMYLLNIEDRQGNQAVFKLVKD